MKLRNSKQTILRNNKQVLSNIQQDEIEKRKGTLRKKGYVPLAEAKAEGFRKIGYDVYQRKEDGDAGNIWSVEDIDGESWLVCYTDQNDNILRNLKEAAKKHRIQKTAKNTTMATVMNPGDVVEITPRFVDSIHQKYTGKKGEVTAAMPDRTQLTFDDGSSLWVENVDLTQVKDARELSMGDTVRMFSNNNIEGKVTKFGSNKKYIFFENEAGQEFTARLGEVCKITKIGLVVQNIFTDPTNPDERKLLKEYMQGQVQQQIPQPTEESVQTLETAMTPGEVPPTIKAQPSAAEMAAGTTLPASQFANKDVNLVGFVKCGRTLNIGDMVQKKSTGQNGAIVDISFDRKLGKFYMIDFGSGEPVMEYDTDIMKLSPTRRTEPPIFPTDTVRTREQFPTRAEGPVASKRAVIDSKYDVVKTAALEFIEGMVSQALKQHEAEAPGEIVKSELENELVKQAIITYMSKYLPVELRQTMSAEDKNALSEWLYDETAEVEAPTTEEFVPEAPVSEQKDPWDLTANYRTQQTQLENVATDKLSNEIDRFTKITMINPTELHVLRDKQKFVKDAVKAMKLRGLPTDVAHLISQHVVSMKDVNFPLLQHEIKRMAYQCGDQIIETAGDALAFTTFSTVEGKKFALDLPGMETLRGGGGGYPGGLDVEPMGWTVRNPQGEGVDQGRLEEALQENLEDQSVPFEEAAPKINIELDPENKRITIDYGQEEEPPIELAEGPQEPEVPGVGSTGIPPTTPGRAEQKPGGGTEDFGDQEVPVNF